jgi:hypothetical protein
MRSNEEEPVDAKDPASFFQRAAHRRQALYYKEERNAYGVLPEKRALMTSDRQAVKLLGHAK